MGIIFHLFPDKAMSDHIPIIFLVPGPFISRFCDGPQHPRLVSGRKKKLGVWTGLKNSYRFNIVIVQISFSKYVEKTCPKYLPERPKNLQSSSPFTGCFSLPPFFGTVSPLPLERQTGPKDPWPRPGPRSLWKAVDWLGVSSWIYQLWAIHCCLLVDVGILWNFHHPSASRITLTKSY